MGRRVVIISDEFWPMIFGKHSAETERGFMVDPRTALPDDAKMVSAEMVFRGLGTQELHLLLESSEWTEQALSPVFDLRIMEHKTASNPIRFREFT